jgi:hypothetical protein
MSSRFTFVARLIAAAIIGVSYPYAELAWKCRSNSQDSEACVWGRAYMPLSRWAEPLIVIPVAFLLLTVVIRLLSRGHRRDDTPNEEL